MAVRQEQKRQTRELILRTAYLLFEDRGLLATKTSDIAEAAHISHGSVFAHFPTRDQLLEAVIEDVGRNIATRVQEGSGRKQTARDVLTTHVKCLTEYEAFYARLVSEGPFLPAAARRVLVEIQSAIATQLDEALSRERPKKGARVLPIDLVFNTWIGLLHHYLVNRDLFAPGQSVLSKMGPRLVDYFMTLTSPTSRADEKGEGP
ncbi:MAG: TetR/AcrR family transcriptional regulator [Polyangiaceae bacterium]|nr:TetR/AcrR family transcriptional regulator [Polyangiaceae bacterium]